MNAGTFFGKNVRAFSDRLYQSKLKITTWALEGKVRYYKLSSVNIPQSLFQRKLVAMLEWKKWNQPFLVARVLKDSSLPGEEPIRTNRTDNVEIFHGCFGCAALVELAGLEDCASLPKGL
jgi:hypothetical protein